MTAVDPRAVLAEAREFVAHVFDACCRDDGEIDLLRARALSSRIDAALAGMGWQPIATAPRDGTHILISAAQYQDLPGFLCVAWYHPDGGFCVDELRSATHWMPLPEPPGAEGK